MMFTTGLEVDIDVIIYWQEMPLYMISLYLFLNILFFSRHKPQSLLSIAGNAG